MATNDEIMRLILQVQGEAEAKALDAEIERLRAQILALGRTASATDPMMLGLGARLKGMIDDSARLEQAFGRAGRGGRGMTDAIQGSSRAFQDFTSAAMNGGILQGLNAVTNNVDQAAVGFARMGGASAETAAKIASFGTIAIVGLQLLIPVLKAAADKLGLFKEQADEAAPAVDKLKARIKELNDNPLKTQADRDRLKDLTSALKIATSAQEALNAARGLKSKSERESESAVTEVVGEAGGVARDLVEAEKARRLAGPAAAKADAAVEAQRKIATERRRAAADPANRFRAGMETFAQEAEAELAALEARAQAIREKAVADAEAKVDDLLKPAEPGRVAEKNEDLAKAVEASGRKDAPELAAKVRGASPAGMKRKAEDAARISQDNEAEESSVKAAQDAASEAAKQLEETDREIVKGLGEWATRQVLTTGEVTRDAVARAIEAAGYDLDPDGRRVGAVMKGLGEEYKKKVRTHAIGMNAGVEAAQADMLADLQEKDLRATEAAAARDRRRQGETPEQHKARLAREKDEREAASRAESDAKRLGGGAGGMTMEGEAFLAREAARRAQADALPKQERAAVIRMARRAGDPIRSAAEAEQEVEQAFMNRMSSTTTTDKDGNPLDAAQRRRTARAMVGDAKSDLQRRSVMLQGQVGNEVMRTQALLAQLLDGQDRQAAEIRRRNDQMARRPRGNTFLPGGRQ